MTCGELTSYGIENWQDLSAIRASDVPKFPGVYVFRFPSAIPRFSGESDILYIGCAHRGTLCRRLADHLSETRYDLFAALATPSRFKMRLDSLRQYALQIGWKVTFSGDEAKALERTLLDRYLSYHDELPPLNSRVG